MDPLSIAALGWLMNVLVNKAVTALFEAWAKRMGLKNEFKNLQKQLLKLDAQLSTAHHHRTDNSFLELVPDLEQLVFRVVNLLAELDYYRLEDKIQIRGTEENVNCSNELSAMNYQLHSCSASDALDPLPKNFCFRNNLSQRMNELAKQFKTYKWKVSKAEEKRPLLITSQNTEKSQTEATNFHQTLPFHNEHRKVVGSNQDRGQPLNLSKNEESTEVGQGSREFGFNSSSIVVVSVDPLKSTSLNQEMASRKRDWTTFEADSAVDSKKPKKQKLVAKAVTGWNNWKNHRVDLKSVVTLTQKNLEMSQELTNLKAENKKLKADLAKSSAKVIKRFLGSRGFKCAAQLACLDQMKFTIYRELEKLGQVYPFVPEQLGYTPISSELAVPKDLSAYTWDEDKDFLYNPDGEQVPSRLTLENHAPTGVKHIWHKDAWPRDLYSVDAPISGSPLLDQCNPDGHPKTSGGPYTKEDMEAQKETS